MIYENGNEPEFSLTAERVYRPARLDWENARAPAKSRRNARNVALGVNYITADKNIKEHSIWIFHVNYLAGSDSSNDCMCIVNAANSVMLYNLILLQPLPL